MCGIVGASSKENLNLSDIKLMLYLADDRGGHSTGFINGERILRSTDNAKKFLAPCKELEFPEKNKYFIGHTRFATEGKKNLANSHPFDFYDVTGVHNGTIDNFKQLKKQFGDEALKKFKETHETKEYIQKLTEVESDSMMLYYLISEYGLEDILPDLKGTMALAYMTRDGNTHIYRFDKPLCYGFKDGELWYGSKKDWLEVLGCTNIKPFRQNTHYVIKDGNIEEAIELEDANAPEKSNQRDDLDSGFTKAEQMEGYPEKKPTANRNSESDGGSDNSDKEEDVVVDEIPEDTIDEFKLGKNAKAGLSEDGKVLLWTFSEQDENILYVEVEGYENVLIYDLSTEKDMTGFKFDCPEIMNEVLQEYEALELAADIRKDKTAYVKLKQ